MQVTDKMVAAAARVLFGPGCKPASVLCEKVSDALQAALDAAGSIDLPVTASIRVQIDEQAFRASTAEAVQHLHDTLPRDESGRITLATLVGAQVSIPLTEPRPLATVGELHYYLGESREFVLRAAAGMPEYDPPFPDPVREYGEDREPLYDPEAVKAWYGALPQATDG